MPLSAPRGNSLRSSTLADCPKQNDLGIAFAAPLLESTCPPIESEARMSKHVFLYTILGLSVAGFLFSRTIASGPKQKSAQYAEPVRNPDGVYNIGAVRLWREYEENEVAADIRYKNERLSVTGTIVSIERDYEGRPILHLFGGNAIFPVVVTLDKADIPAAAQLKKGDQVSVRCIGAGREMRMPQLERCLML
jgi:hypothetical protein